eukprot:9585868-Karenia_brevis.AAC.1
MENKFETIHKQLEIDASKLSQANSPSYNRPADPTLLKVNSVWATTPKLMRAALEEFIDSHVSPAD